MPILYNQSMEPLPRVIWTGWQTVSGAKRQCRAVLSRLKYQSEEEIEKTNVVELYYEFSDERDAMGQEIWKVWPSNIPPYDFTMQGVLLMIKHTSTKPAIERS